jgi:hypothetical protein
VGIAAIRDFQMDKADVIALCRPKEIEMLCELELIPEDWAVNESTDNSEEKVSALEPSKFENEDAEVFVLPTIDLDEKEPKEKGLGLKEALNDDSVKVSKQEKKADSDDCSICFKNPVNSALVPCGHMGTCIDCAQFIQKKQFPCPYCRNPVQMVVKLFRV